MQRKLVKQGNNALTVTLPAKWLQERNLTAGDLVEIEEEEKAIIIRTQKKEIKVKQNITLTQLSQFFLERVITNAYKRGIDTLHLLFNDTVPVDTINEILAAYTVGYEITLVEKKKCTIQSFTAEDQDNVDITARKCFLLVKEMNSILINDIKQRKYTHATNILSLTNNTRKLANYSIRVNTKTSKNVSQLLYQSTIFTKLYLFALRINSVYILLGKTKKTNPHIIELINHLNNMFDIYYQAYFSKELSSIKELLDTKDVITLKLEKSIDNDNGKIFLHIHSAMRCIHDSVGSLLGLMENGSVN